RLKVDHGGIVIEPRLVVETDLVGLAQDDLLDAILRQEWRRARIDIDLLGAAHLPKRLAWRIGMIIDLHFRRRDQDAHLLAEGLEARNVILELAIYPGEHVAIRRIELIRVLEQNPDTPFTHGVEHLVTAETNDIALAARARIMRHR